MFYHTIIFISIMGVTLFYKININYQLYKCLFLYILNILLYVLYLYINKYINV